VLYNDDLFLDPDIFKKYTMLIKLLKGKLHRGTVTDSQLEYPGSIAIDPVLLDAAGMLPYEKVLIADVDNGNRLETYTVLGKPNSGEISILGAAAHRIKKGDTIIIMAFALCTPQEAADLVPKVVVLDKSNNIVDLPNRKS